MKPLRSPAAILSSVPNGKPQVVDAGCEGEDRETDGHQPSGQPVPELPVFKSLDSRHHADSLRGSATRCSVAKADWGAGEAGQWVHGPDAGVVWRRVVSGRRSRGGVAGNCVNGVTV